MGINKNAITFGAGFNISLPNAIDSRMVVDNINDLTTSWKIEGLPTYKGMVVSVKEDGNIYVLTDDNYEDPNNWKKIGSDSETKLSAPITVAGLPDGIFGAGIENGKEYTTEDTIEQILRDLLCKEIYPTVSLLPTNPIITFEGAKGATASNYKSIMRIGSVLNLNEVTLNEATISDCSRVASGFKYGYSTSNDCTKDGDGNPQKVDGTSSLTGKYSLIESYSPSSIGTVRTSNSSENYEDVKFSSGSVTIGLGSNKISFKSTSPSGVYSHPEYPEYYVVSNLGNTDSKYILQETDAVNGTVDSVEVNSEISITGVYPVYVNIDFDAGKLISDTNEMTLTKSKEIVIDVPTEVETGLNFMFDYPATHSINNFNVKSVDGNFTEFKGSYEKEFETLTKVVEGNEIEYKRLKTTGKSTEGPGTYQIILSFGLNTDKKE